ncbi:MAG: 5-(carboxyamino)imidazole ribonucleotide mutase [Endozoicomonadaceae bacterium]|nr:5-(carboxyamino)imidazole ribonucleotide mutase [Endozoicomonadaceae bacterium]
MKKQFVAILMGSDADFPKIEPALSILKKFNIHFEVRIHSAHRTPEITRTYVQDAEKRDCAAFICCAGMAAHLAGAVAAQTIRPVIGVPINASPLQGMDALLSTVQMPSGIPVATTAIDSAGAKNAAYLAIQIMGVANESLHHQLKQERAEQAEIVLKKNHDLQSKLA